jgi:hypothetical protein
MANIARAEFVPLLGDNEKTRKAGKAIPVHFNPESLSYTITNNLTQKKSKTAKQFVSDSSGSLTMDLVFDTTDTGASVQSVTKGLYALAGAKGKGTAKTSSGKTSELPQIVQFKWGNYKFEGIIQSYKEQLEFFSADGVPLRAVVNITLVEHKVEPNDDKAGSDSDAATAVPAAAGVPVGGGDTKAMRQLGYANGLPQPRLPSGQDIFGDIKRILQTPLKFAPFGDGGSGFGFGLDIGIGGGIGLDIGIDLGIDLPFDLDKLLGGGDAGSLGRDVDAESSEHSAPDPTRTTQAPSSSWGTPKPAQATRPGTPAAAAGPAQNKTPAGPGFPRTSAPPSRFGNSRASSYAALGAAPAGPRFGSRASAGVSASEGAFSGLRRPPDHNVPLDLEALLPAQSEADLYTEDSLAFELGGRAVRREARGLGTDVGVDATLASAIRFDEE